MSPAQSIPRDESRAMREGVLLLHGIGRTARSMRRMERALRAAGFATYNCDYPSRRHDLATLAEIIAAEAEAWRATLDRVHIVTHSMGGLIARILVARHAAGPSGFAPPAPPGRGQAGSEAGRAGGKLGRTVMLAPPNGGSEIADLLMPWALYHRIYGPAGAQLGTAGWGAALDDCVAWPAGAPLLIIAGTRSIDPLGWLLLPKPNDGKVSVESSGLAGATHITLLATHTFIMHRRVAIDCTIHSLRTSAPHLHITYSRD